MRYLEATQFLIEIAAKHGYKRDQVIGPSRNRQLVLCRREITYRLRNAGMSWHDIGAIINRHHTTCMEQFENYATVQREVRDSIAFGGGSQTISKGWRQDRCGSDYMAAW